MLSPASSACSPVPVTDALVSLTVAVTLIVVTSFATSTVYSSTSGLNAGVRVPSVTLNSLKVASLFLALLTVILYVSETLSTP